MTNVDYKIMISKKILSYHELRIVHIIVKRNILDSKIFTISPAMQVHIACPTAEHSWTPVIGIKVPKFKEALYMYY